MPVLRRGRMDNFKIIYRILKYLEAAMDSAAPELTPILPDALGISKERWKALLLLLAQDGYISGVSCKEYLCEESVLNISKIKITLKGLEYLSENAMMKKVICMAKDVRQLLP